MIPPNPHRPIIDDRGLMTPEFRDWVIKVSRLEILESIGSPEGVVQGYLNQLCKDTETGTIYVKHEQDSLTAGWVQV